MPATFALALRQYAPVNTAFRRRAAYISPATAAVSLTLVSVNGTAQSGAPMTYTVGPTAPNCSAASGIVTCNLAADVPIGTDVLTASTLDANGNTLGTSTIAATIQANAQNLVPLAIGGVIASLQLYLSRTSFSPGPAETSNIIVVPLDSSGAEIVNPGDYNPAIAVTLSSSASGHLSLITDGVNTGQTGTLASPNDQVVLSYDGIGTSGSSTVTASAGSGITASSGVGISTPGLSASPSGPQLVHATTAYVFSAPGQTGTIAVSGGTAPYTIVTSDPTVATVGGSSPSFTVTSVGYGTTGSATLTITDAAMNQRTIDVTYLAPPVTLAVTSCGTGSSCTSQAVTFPLTNPASPAIAPSTIAASGGDGTYSYAFASTGTTTSAFGSVSQSGNTFTLTPNGSGNDALVVLSGNQTGYIAFLENSLAAALPAAYGMLLEQTGKAFSANLPSGVDAVANSGPAIAGLAVNAGSPPTVTGTTTAAGTGALTFTTAGGASASVPFTVFGLTFVHYPGAGASAAAESATPADEQFTAAGESDTVNVTGVSGTLSAVSSNAAVTSVSVSGDVLTVDAVAAGLATITLSDSGTGASATYSVSVTTTSIPISSERRAR